MSVSLLIELDNVRLKGIDRARAGLSAAAEQVIQNISEISEVLIGVPGRAPWVDALLSDAGFDKEPLAEKTHMIDVGEGLYYEAKNHLAECARGDWLIMVDSDVIPQTGWLAHFLCHSAENNSQLVAGRTVIGPLTSLYERAISSVWIYDPRPRRGIESTDRFYANNFMIRRSLFLSFKFQSLEGQYRMGCTNLAETLRDKGVPMLRDNSALTLHPAPLLFRDAFYSQLLSGRDRALKWRDLPARDFVKRSFRYLFFGWYWATRNSILCRKASRQTLLEVPLSFTLANIIWFLRAFGLVLGRLNPKALNSHR